MTRDRWSRPGAVPPRSPARVTGETRALRSARAVSRNSATLHTLPVPFRRIRGGPGYWLVVARERYANGDGWLPRDWAVGAGWSALAWPVVEGRDSVTSYIMGGEGAVVYQAWMGMGYRHWEGREGQRDITHHGWGWGRGVVYWPWLGNGG